MSRVTQVAASAGSPARRSRPVSGCSKAVSSSAAMHGTTTMYSTPRTRATRCCLAGAGRGISREGRRPAPAARPSRRCGPAVRGSGASPEPQGPGAAPEPGTLRFRARRPGPDAGRHLGGFGAGSRGRETGHWPQTWTRSSCHRCRVGGPGGPRGRGSPQAADRRVPGPYPPEGDPASRVGMAGARTGRTVAGRRTPVGQAAVLRSPGRGDMRARRTVFDGLVRVGAA
jgi:hypothetical protein